MSKVNSESRQPLVSVIIPSYNHAQWVQSCIESVAAADYPRLELLILDDGSRDATYDIAKSTVFKYEKSFERVWLDKQDNQGITKSLNTLVRHARGKYIIPLASDDELTEHGIRHCVEHMEEGDNAAKLLFINVDVIDKYGNQVDETRIDRFSKKIDNKILARDIILFFGTPYQSHIFSKNEFQKLGGYDDNLKYEDLDLALRFISLGRITFIKEKVKRYRLWRNGETTPGLSRGDLDRRPIYQKNLAAQKGLIKFLCLLIIRRDISFTCRIILSIMAKLHSYTIDIQYSSLRVKSNLMKIWHALCRPTNPKEM